MIYFYLNININKTYKKMDKLIIVLVFALVFLLILKCCLTFRHRDLKISTFNKNKTFCKLKPKK